MYSTTAMSLCFPLLVHLSDKGTFCDANRLPKKATILYDMSGFFVGTFGGSKMINFEEELKNFQPSLEVDEAETAIYNHDMTDVSDIIQEMMQELKKNR